MWHKGTHRFVWVIGPFVLKFPKVRMKRAVGMFVQALRNTPPGFRSTSFELMRRALFDGLKENFREARCYLKTRHRLLARLYLPLIMVNVYRREDGVGDFTFDKHELSLAIIRTGDEGYKRAGCMILHTSGDPNNFAYNSNGQVKILDYGEGWGNQTFEKFLLGYGDRFETLLLSKAKHPT